jgi:hypothetical protein
MDSEGNKVGLHAEAWLLPVVRSPH